MVDNDIIYIKYLMKMDKSFYTYTELCNKYGCNINVMQFNSVLSAIPWKGVIKELERRHSTLSDSLLEVVLFNANPCKKLYKSLIRQKYRQAPTCEQTWPVQFIDENTNVELTWKDIYKNIYISSIDNNFRNFQLKLIHRCLPQKRILFAADKKDNPYCNFCNTEIDNLTHIYVSCEKTQEFWIDIIRFINSMFSHIMSLNTIDIIFGTYMSDIHLLSFIVLSAKYFIHCAYWNGNLPNIQTYMSKLHKYEHIERLIALEKDKLDIHDKKWKKYLEMQRI